MCFFKLFFFFFQQRAADSNFIPFQLAKTLFRPYISNRCLYINTPTCPIYQIFQKQNAAKLQIKQQQQQNTGPELHGCFSPSRDIFLSQSGSELSGRSKPCTFLLSWACFEGFIAQQGLAQVPECSFLKFKTMNLQLQSVPLRLLCSLLMTPGALW